MPRKVLPLLGCAVVALALALASFAGSAAGGRAEPDGRLLARYEPVMQFDPLEQFMPTRVKTFVRDADLEQLTAAGTWSVVDPSPRPRRLPGPNTGTWRLNETACTPSATLGGLACYAAAEQPGRTPVVYGRVARENGQIVLQYWYFYYDDVYSYAYPPSDFIWQAHEGDWEDVNVVLSGDGQPQYVGYSQHCLGQRRAWADTTRFRDTHPVVHVGVGSHANYFSSGTHPIDPSCIPAQALAILQANHLPLPVDYANEGPIAGPPGSGGSVMRVHALGDRDAGWLQFPGTWGEAQYFHAPPPIGTLAFGASPVGPAYHAEWNDPLGTLASWPLG